jgi:hypothetical protein
MVVALVAAGARFVNRKVDGISILVGELLRHGTWLGDTIATQAGLDIESPGFAGSEAARV